MENLLPGCSRHFTFRDHVLLFQLCQTKMPQYKWKISHIHMQVLVYKIASFVPDTCFDPCFTLISILSNSVQTSMQACILMKTVAPTCLL